MGNFLAVLGMSGALLTGGVAQAAVDWDPYVVRDNTPPIIYSERPSGQGVDVTISVANQKLAYGTSAFNGLKLSEIESFSYEVIDDLVGAELIYLNLWVTDGTNFAVIAPQWPTTNPLPDVVNDFQSMVLGVYETPFGNPGDLDWLFPGATRDTGLGYMYDPSNQLLTLADLNPNLVLASPYPAGYDESSDPDPYTIDGGGAPKAVHAFNLMFGSSGDQYLGQYSIDNIEVTTFGDPIPEPASLSLLALGGAALMMRRRRA